MEQKEIWKDIKGFEGLYQVSNLGRVKSVRMLKATYYLPERCANRILSPTQPGKARYYRVLLYKNNYKKFATIHRLVAEAFIPNPSNLPCVNHKDENPLNNHVDNLEWCTQQYNCVYGTVLKRRSNTCRKNLGGNLGRIYAFSKSGELVGKFDSVWDAAQMPGIRTKSIRGVRNHIVDCCNNKCKSAHGYIWRYEKDVLKNHPQI